MLREIKIYEMDVKFLMAGRDVGEWRHRNERFIFKSRSYFDFAKYFELHINEYM